MPAPSFERPPWQLQGRTSTPGGLPGKHGPTQWNPWQLWPLSYGCWIWCILWPCKRLRWRIFMAPWPLWRAGKASVSHSEQITHLFALVLGSLFHKPQGPYLLEGGGFCWPNGKIGPFSILWSQNNQIIPEADGKVSNFVTPLVYQRAFSIRHLGRWWCLTLQKVCPHTLAKGSRHRCFTPESHP